MAEQDIIVIGAGVVGAATALALRREGHGVLLIDREGPAAGASSGNAGAIVNESCAPTAMPGVWKQALASIGDPLSPLSIRPSYLPRAAPWLLRFLLASRQGRVTSIARELHALTQHAVSDWRKLTKGTTLDGFFHDGGWLKVYETEAAFEKTAAARELMDALGVGYELLSADGIQNLEPALAPIFHHGIFQKSSLRCDDTAGLVRAMVDEAVSAGAAFRVATVTALEPQGQRVRVRCGSETLDARRVVVAAGAWSRRLAAQVGHKVPLDTDQPDAARLAGMALLFSSETARFATDRSLQYHGGYGFSEEYDIQMYHRRASAWILQLGEPGREYARLADTEFGPRTSGAAA